MGKHLKKKNRYFDIHAWSFLALGILSVILVNFAPEDDHHHKKHSAESRILALRDLADGEITVISSWAKGSLHKLTGKAANIITLLMILQGMFMRFMIVSRKDSVFHSCKQYNLTLSRRIHTVGGITVWLLTRITLLSGSAIHSR